ncbi:hypothetical protein QTP88_029503 [Uroleucon formosanum]
MPAEQMITEVCKMNLCLLFVTLYKNKKMSIAGLIFDFNCDDCGITYKYYHFLKRHLPEKHNIQQINAKVKPIKCQKCNKTFTLKTNMIRHMKTLHSEKMNEANNLEFKIPDGYDYTVIEYTSLGEEQFIAKFDIKNVFSNTRPEICTTPSQKHYNCKATLG